MNNFDVLTIGGAVQDITFYTSEGKVFKNPKKDPTCLKLLGFEYGAKMKIDEANFSFGGGAQNAAVCMSRLGFKVATLICVGDDTTGQSIRENLRKNKVNTKFVQVSKKSNTGFSFILTDNKTSEHVAFSYRGANSDLKIRMPELDVINPRWIYLTSLSDNWEKNVFSRIFDYAVKNAVKIAWNPGNRQLADGYDRLEKYLIKTNVLILNKDEATELVLTTGNKCDVDIEYLLRQLHNMICDKKFSASPSVSAKIVVVTNGRKGAYAFDGKKNYHAPIIEVKRVDTTGVGDAFGSSFIAGLEIYDRDIEKALRLGVINTSSVIGKIGAENGLLYRRNII